MICVDLSPLAPPVCGSVCGGGGLGAKEQRAGLKEARAWEAYCSL